jgi:hypothetical protein
VMGERGRTPAAVPAILKQKMINMFDKLCVYQVCPTVSTQVGELSISLGTELTPKGFTAAMNVTVLFETAEKRKGGMRQ